MPDVFRLKDMLQLGRPKTPGFGINSVYYLSILAGTAQLPAPLSVATPKGDGETVAGFIAPLAAGKSKDDLNRPMTRGFYAVASANQKTVLKLTVVPREEAGFDPQAFLHSPAAAGLEPEVRQRIASTWTLLQLTFESFDPAVYPALDFLLGTADRLAQLTQGVVADPVSQVYRLPGRVLTPRPADLPVAVQDVVQVKTRPSRDGLHMFTLGMQKFALHEYELDGVPADLAETAARILLGVCQGVLRGATLPIGSRLGSPSAPLRVAEGGLDRGLWEGVPCDELIPDQTGGLVEALSRWATENPSSASE